MPSMLLWGQRDRIIPASHGRLAHEAMPGSRYELFEGSGHFPHVSEPRRFAAALRSFIDETEPAEVTDEEIREVLLRGAR
jgi:pimeloyl-ACP methyl ester carboxylesterase